MSSVSDEDVNKIEPVVITTNKVPPGLYVPAQTYEGEKGFVVIIFCCLKFIPISLNYLTGFRKTVIVKENTV